MPFILNKTAMKQQVLEAVAKVTRYLGPPHEFDCLDLGCSSGIAELFLDNYFRNIVAVDINRNLLNQTQKLKLKGTTLLCTNAMNLPFKENSFDVTIAFSLLHHLPFNQQLCVLEGARRVTRSDGLIIMLEYNPLNPVTQFVVKTNKQDRDSILITPGRMRMLYQRCKLNVIDFGYILLSCKYMIIGRK